jgi:molecular chaperone DnaK (HSP70)
MIIGIDLGTTYSLGATLNLDHQPVLLPDNSDKNVLYTPSILHINGNNAFVGQSVMHMLEQNPDLGVVRFFKRYLGDNKELHMDGMGDVWYPESIAALVLKKIKYDAEIYASNTVEGAVITIPAHFSDAQRKSVLHAAAMIDLPVLGLVEEPVAAAMHYGISNKAVEQNILVYDLGGGTFDSTVLSMSDRSFYVLSKDGLTDLGGKEFDEAIAGIIHEQFERSSGKALVFTGRKLQQLRVFSEEVKIELSCPGVQYVNRMCLLGDDNIEVFISRKEFERAITPYIDRTLKILKRCISSANLREEDIDVLLLVGGSSMVPFVQQHIKATIPKLADKIRFQDPMKAVVYGAAIYARMLSGKDQPGNVEMPSELKGVTGYNLAVRAVDTESGRTILDIIIPKNRPVPLKVKKTYYTAPNNGGKMRIELAQFIEEDDIKTMGVLNVGPLPSNEANYPIEITLEYTEDNVVVLQAYDPRSGRELEKTFGKEGMGATYLAAQKKLVQKAFINNVI